jgi:polar amino acid transport system substrate-binding protein
VAAGIAKRAPDRFSNKFVLLQQEMAVAMRPGQPETLKAINELVDRNIKNGEFSKLYQKWLGTPLPELKQ